MLSFNEIRTGDAVQFTHKGRILKGKIVRVNTKSCTLELENGGKARVSPCYLSKCNSTCVTMPQKRILPKPSFTPSGISTHHDLQCLCDDVKKMIMPIVDKVFTPEEKKMFANVRVQWGKRDTYRNCGWYKPLQNLIQITKSFKNVPREAIEATMWHELLHIHFTKSQGRQAHSHEFKFYERQYPNYHEGNEFKHAWMQYLRSVYT